MISLKNTSCHFAWARYSGSGSEEEDNSDNDNQTTAVAQSNGLWGAIEGNHSAAANHQRMSVAYSAPTPQEMQHAQAMCEQQHQRESAVQPQMQSPTTVDGTRTSITQELGVLALSTQAPAPAPAPVPAKKGERDGACVAPIGAYTNIPSANLTGLRQG